MWIALVFQRLAMTEEGREMTEDEKLRLNLSEKLLKLMLNEKIPFEKKIGNMDYLIRLGADVNKQVYGKSIALWAKELGDDDVVKYVKENGGVETEILKEESEEILSGEAGIAPYKCGKKTGCDYCGYASVCGFDKKSGSKYRMLPPMSDEEVFEKIKKQSREE